MTDTTRFQPGDKVKAGAFVADLGLTPGRIYTVHHVDDFGLVQPETARHHHYHPSHFELVMRAVADETYCLLDGEGDWWFFDNEDGYWYMVDGHLVRFSLFEGAEDINGQYGIDAEPTAPAETYCLKDTAGDWWVSDGTSHFLITPRGTYSTRSTPEMAADQYTIDAEPLPSMKGVEPTHAEVDEVQNWPETDQRIGAWERITDHSIFRPCYAEERPLVDAMMAKLDRIYSEGASPAVSAPDSCSECASYDPNTGLHWDTCPNRGSVHAGSSDAGNSTGPSLRFEAVPLQPEPGDRARIVRTSATDASHGIADGMRDVGDEFIVTEVGTNDHGPFAKGDAGYWWHPEDLEKVTDSPAPLQPGDWVKVLARVEQVYSNGSVQAQTFQSDGTKNGTRFLAIASAITRTDEVPEWAREKPAVCPSLHHVEDEGVYIRCEDTDGHTGFHGAGFSPGWKSWDDSDGRVEVTER